ncbi:uncharacterized protein DNG_00941 [Cephalotrichum gorgonifer]|uniref:GPI anchored protein n=1 Tax=Cephalotrichum gorgonifer TaxID=2041049 RepID=A0AAE8MPM2_9PEZI|nr:uncharacterized protein DNG_00941 [Cephalotrichum gorgonifer]
MNLDVFTKMLALPPTLLLLVASQLAAAQAQAPPAGAPQVPTAIRKMPPDGSAKFFPEYVAFGPALSYEEARIYPREGARRDGGGPGFNLHEEEDEEGRSAFRRAAEVLGVLRKRESCPPTMSGCGDVGYPNKCCFEEEECVEVDNPAVGNVACCPQGVDCGGGVGSCPPTAVTCPESLGGGCCIAGYICKGSGCVRESSSTSVPAGGGATTITTTSTNWADGNPSTVVVTIVTTLTNDGPTTTSTTVITKSESTTSSKTTGPAAPFRPTNDNGGDAPSPTGSFCPTGFYACLARAGGGCCQTGRDCKTTSCAPTPMTTFVRNGVTVAVPVADVPQETGTATCAGGWFLCKEDDDAGDQAGCCPSGYACGRESCTIVTPTETAEVQKLRPGEDSGAASGVRRGGILGMLVCLGVAASVHLL